MEGSAIAPPRQVKSQSYLILTVLLGIAGSLVAMVAFGKGEYRVGTLLVEMSVRPDTSGTTELAVTLPADIAIRPGHAEAETHTGFLAFRGTVIGTIGSATQVNLQELAQTVKDPSTLATTIRDQGKDAFRRFGIRVGLVVLAGGAAGGFAIALVGMKARRIFQGALAGVVVVAALGALAWQTYDIDEFSKTTFRPAGQAQILQR